MPVAVVVDAAPVEGSGSLLATMDKVDLDEDEMVYRSEFDGSVTPKDVVAVVLGVAVVAFVVVVSLVVVGGPPPPPPPFTHSRPAATWTGPMDIHASENGIYSYPTGQQPSPREISAAENFCTGGRRLP
ncbi:hypothetical protein C8J57DRAFT_1246659 [Mycena rebaudengoi]|nr:hypothetical protein C8J57DRAFT_1246659 [Mycena rebaudengoi]